MKYLGVDVREIGGNNGFGIGQDVGNVRFCPHVRFGAKFFIEVLGAEVIGAAEPCAKYSARDFACVKISLCLTKHVCSANPIEIAIVALGGNKDISKIASAGRIARRLWEGVDVFWR